MAKQLKLSILFLTYQGDMAGSTQSIAYLAEGMAKKGHTVVVGCRRESWLWKLLENTDVNLIPMTFRNKFDRENIRQIASAVEKYDIDIINAQSSKDRYTSIFARLFKKLDVRIVHTRRQMPKSSGGWMQAKFYQWGTDKIVAVSEGVKHALVNNGFRADHISVIYNGTPTEKYATIDKKKVNAIRKQYNPDDLPMIGCVARLKKQVQLVLASRKIEFPICMHFGGLKRSDFDEDIINSIPSFHRVNFTGTLSLVEALHHTAAIDIYVLPSTMEGLSQSLLEAMALGVPVIATRAGGNADLIRHGENGMLFEDGDVAQIAELVKELSFNTPLKEKLIQNGRKTALEDFSLDRTVENYVHFYTELIKGS
jgi:glycosyltransferase involved in cell wall biosynthesis